MTDTALVTGAAGFIGVNIARRLCADGLEVHLVVRPDSDLWRLQDMPPAELHEVDLTNARAVEALVRAVKPAFIYHAAAHGAYSTQRDAERMVSVNINGTLNLLRASSEAGFTGFVYTGTSSEYGFKDFPPREDETLEPNSDYAVTKAAATLYCRYFAESRSLNVSTLRVYSAYGPYEEPTRLIPMLVTKGLDGTLPTLAAPHTARDYTHVHDVVDACLIAASAGNGEIYNVGTGVQTTLAEAVFALREMLQIEAEPSWGSMPGRDWDTGIWVSNPSRIAAELGWKAELDFAAGLRQTVDWLRDTPGMLDLYRRRQSSP